jgi:Na+/phosphate symporter
MSEKGLGTKLDRLLTDRSGKLALLFLALVSPIIGSFMVSALKDIYTMMNKFELQIIPQIEQIHQEQRTMHDKINDSTQKIVGIQRDIDWLKDGQRGQ